MWLRIGKLGLNFSDPTCINFNACAFKLWKETHIRHLFLSGSLDNPDDIFLTEWIFALIKRANSQSPPSLPADWRKPSLWPSSYRGRPLKLTLKQIRHISIVSTFSVQRTQLQGVSDQSFQVRASNLCSDVQKGHNAFFSGTCWTVQSSSFFLHIYLSCFKLGSDLSFSPSSSYLCS